jgi:hypothetical protein
VGVRKRKNLTEVSVREIKFRAWIKDIQKMIYFDDFGYRDEYNELAWGMRDNSPIPDREEGYPIYNDRLSKAGASTEKENFVLQQFTGFRDKAGTEIYEGDIIRHSQGVDEVRWRLDGWHVGNWTPGYLSEFAQPEYDDDEFPVIVGNIYETP